MIGIIDTCFLIDWSKFSLRDVIFRLFDTVVVPEQVLTEVKSEDTLMWLARRMGEERIQLFTPIPRQLNEASRLVRESYTIPKIRRLDLPEAICLVVGREYGFIVLTENRGALMIKEILPELSSVKVWRALEVLKECMIRRVIKINNENDIRVVFKHYEEDTFHIFPTRDLELAIKEVIRSVERGSRRS